MAGIGLRVAAGVALMVGGLAFGQERGVGHEAYRWRSVEIGGGGFTTGIVMSGGKQGVMLARTDVGGAYRWEGDGNGGRWVPLLDWVTRKDWNLWGVESAAMDPADANRMYLACGTYTRPFVGNGVMLRSMDGGKTFARTQMAFQMGGNEDGRFAGERLAVDGAKGSVLLFGSRNAGLWRSEDYGEKWTKVESFPVSGKTNGVGIAFVLFGSPQAPAGAATQVIFVGVSGSGTSAAAAGIYRSGDAGTTWEKMKGQPEGLAPNHGVLAGDGMLYVSYGDVPGPNGMTSGAVWKCSTVTGEWWDVTPVRPSGNTRFGYGAVAVDAQHPGTVMAATMDRWSTGDDVYRSTDGGGKWRGIAKAGVRDAGTAPWITLGRPTLDAGHWMGDVEIDPFDGNHVLYVTGATIWESLDAGAADRGEKTHWRVATPGLEETVVLDLVSPPTGARLISGVGDVGGFVHTDLYTAPAEQMEPAFTNTESIDYAGQAGNVVARVGTIRNGQAGKGHGAYSEDGGKRWRAFAAEPGNSAGGGTIAVSADGKAFVWGARDAVVSWSEDRGEAWAASKGLGGAARGRPVADKVEAGVFYVVESATGRVFVSRDGGRNFSEAEGKVDVRGGGTLRAGPAKAGDLWFGGKNGLEHSTDGGKRFGRVEGVEEVGGIGFGKGRTDSGPAAVFLTGKVRGVEGIFRSDDGGESWREISDAQHAYSNSNHVTGDPRIYGRVYVGTPGRGIVFGDIDAGGGQ
jgi:hypothetical protein